MTDTDDLRRLLDELADETPEVPAQDWLAGARHKVRVRRRVRWAGIGAAAALVLAATVAVVPQVVRTADSEPSPVEPAPEPSEPRNWEFVEGTQTHRIIATRLNDPGESELEWTLSIKGSPQRIDAGIQFCQLPQDAARSDVRLVSSVEGRRMMTSRCRHWDFYPPVAGQMVRQGFSSLRNYGVERDEPFTVSMWLERDGERIDVPGTEFGYGFFWEGRLLPNGAGGGTSLDIPWRRPDGGRTGGPASEWGTIADERIDIGGL